MKKFNWMTLFVGLALTGLPANAEKYTIGIVGDYNNNSTTIDEKMRTVVWDTDNERFPNDTGRVNIDGIDPGENFRIVRFNEKGEITAVFGRLDNAKCSSHSKSDDFFWNELGVSNGRVDGSVPDNTNVKIEDVNPTTIDGYKEGTQYMLEINARTGWVGIYTIPDLYIGGNGFGENAGTAPLKMTYKGNGEYACTTDLKYTDGEHYNFIYVMEGENGIVPQAGNCTRWTTASYSDIKDNNGNVTGTQPANDVISLNTIGAPLKEYPQGTTSFPSMKCDYNIPSARIDVMTKYNPLLTAEEKQTSPTISISSSEYTKIYFVDRAGWGSVSCYNYTDRNIADKGNVLTGDMNAQNPGEMMRLSADEALQAGIAGDDPVYEIFLPGNRNADGNLEFPKLVFYGMSGEGDRPYSRNLYLVDGGIYTNGTTDGEIKRDEYLPRQYFDYRSENPSVMVYPNIHASTEFSYIYVDVPEFYERATTCTEHNPCNIAIEIEFEKDGKSFKATGETGYHTLEPVVINGHKLLRVAFAEDVIPEGTNVKLSVWETHGWDWANRPVNVTDNETTNPETDEAAHQERREGDTGDHHWCNYSHCSLNFDNVAYFDGAVYSRSNEQKNIREIVQPTALYIVNRGEEGTLDESMRVDQSATEIYNQGVDLYAVNPTENFDGKLAYVIRNAKPEAKISFVGYFKGETQDQDQWIKYSYNDGDKEMIPGNRYPFYREKDGLFSIDTSNTPGALLYDITIDWVNSDVYVTPINSRAEFKYGELDPESGAYFGNINGSHVMFAEPDYSEKWETLHIMHNLHYTDRSLAKVSMSRRTEYNKFFLGAPGIHNLPAVCYESQLIEPEESNSDGHSIVKIRAYTAGVALVRVTQEKAAEGFDATEYQVPVRVIPTPASIGFTINYQPAYPANIGQDENYNYIQLDKGENEGEYYIRAITDEPGFELKMDDGQVFTKDRMGFFPVMAYGGKIDGKSAIELYWKYFNEGEKSGENILTAGREASTIVANQTDLKADIDEYANVVADNKLHRYTADRTQGIVMNSEDLRKAGGFYLQIKQNGINSPMYKVNVVKDVVSTDVEELETADSAQPVYYTLSGIKVEAANLTKGIYIKVTGDKTEKVYVK